VRVPVDGSLVLEILDEWNPRWWRALVQGVVLIVGVGLMTHQAWATYLVEHGINWLAQQEQNRLQPLVDSITSSTKPPP
jgi:hypothetical protein